MVVVASESGAKVLQFNELRKELLPPSDKAIGATNKHLVELAKVTAQGNLNKFHDEKIAA